MAQFVTRGDRSGLYITDYEEIIRELNRVSPTFEKDLRKEYRNISKPVKSAVQNAIPIDAGRVTSGIHKKRKTGYQSGFYPKVVPGRLTWGPNKQNKSKQARSVSVQTFSSKRTSRQLKYYKRTKNMSEIAIARLKVDNAATVVASIAGSSGDYINKNSVTREYDYSRSATGKRVHKINGQGISMIAALNRKNRPNEKGSRIVWPAADAARPNTIVQIRIAIDKSLVKINRRLS